MTWIPAYVERPWPTLTENWRKLEAQLDAAEREADEHDEDEGPTGLAAFYSQRSA
jgi:hypothetical protein